MSFFESIAAVSVPQRRLRLALHASLLSVALCACIPTQVRGLFGNDAKDKQSKALAMWQERCKKAGVFIHRTVDDVEGIYLLKLRPEKINFGDQYRLDDPYGRDLAGEGYFLSLLRGSYEANRLPSANASSSSPLNFPSIPKGYTYVEAVDQAGGQRYRYTGSIKAVRKKDATAHNVQLELKRNPNYDLNIYEYVLNKVPSPGPAPRYGLTYDDISTREERDHWIAGSSLKVIDLQTNEMIAERIGYMVDLGQGNNSGGRAPWLMAANSACPSFGTSHAANAQARQSQRFVEQVLKPSSN